VLATAGEEARRRGSRCPSGGPGRGRRSVEEVEEAGLRPRSLAEFVGQAQLVEHLGIVLQAARQRHQPVDHILFAGPPGLGKTSLAGIVATEMGPACASPRAPC
jgi:Holliday junction resolvasome RuvABC ATP-dependent DNA helicase subunit